jgi:hypothetical protein
MESMSSLRYWSGTITGLRRAAEHGHLRGFETPRPRHEHDPQRVNCTSPSWPDRADTVRSTTDSIDNGVLLEDTASATAPIDAALSAYKRQGSGKSAGYGVGDLVGGATAGAIGSHVSTAVSVDEAAHCVDHLNIFHLFAYRFYSAVGP